jgi:hypothetical protein
MLRVIRQRKRSSKDVGGWLSHFRAFVLGSLMTTCSLVLIMLLFGTLSQSPRGAAGGSEGRVVRVDQSRVEKRGERSATVGAMWADATGIQDIGLANLLCARGLPGAEQLDVEEHVKRLDDWAEHVRAETERHMYRFREAPGEFEESEAFFRMLMLAVVLQDDFGVRYNEERISDPAFCDSRDLYIHGMMRPAEGDGARIGGGTCVSMPVLYTAIGRRLGYPLKLVIAKEHVFCRWDGEDHANPAWRERLNIEATSRGLSTYDDDHYRRWPAPLTEVDLSGDWYLRSLTFAEELAEFLITRGHCLLDNGRFAEAQEAYATAHRLAPKCPNALPFLVDAINRELKATN